MCRSPRFLVALAFTSACSSSIGLGGRPSQTAPAPTGAAAKPRFVNGGFEDGGLAGWTVKTNLNNGINYPPASVSDLKLQDGGANLTLALVGANLSLVPPGLSANTSLRLPLYGMGSAVVNQQGKNSNVNSLSQQYTTTAADVDPSDGNVHVRFALAPVLENPNHVDTQQPYFYVVLGNVTQGTTLFSTFNYANQAGVPWKSDPSVADGGLQYTDWQSFDIAPGATKLAPGDTINMQIYAAGCSPGGHFGEVFVDGFGSFLPGLTISGSAPSAANAGSNLVTSYVIENSGTAAATAVASSLVLPTGTTFVSVNAPSATCTTPSVGGTGTVSCTFGSLNPSASLTFTVTVAINSSATGAVSNGNYNISGTGLATLLGPLVTTTITSGILYADLAITKSDGVAAVGWGQAIVYSMVVSNNGPTAVLRAGVSDTLPSSLTNATWSCVSSNDGGCSAPTGSGNLATTVSLPVGATATYTLAATLQSGSGSGTLTNTATVTAPSGVVDNVPGNNSATDTDSIGSLYTLTATKAGNGDGTVVSSPAAIRCGTGCTSAQASYLSGSLISLTATANPGNTFTGWTGACTGSTNPCNITISAATSVSATFTAPTFAITTSTTGNGTLSCLSPVVYGANATCQIVPAAGNQLVALSDNGSSVLGSVTNGTYQLVDVMAAHALSATFAETAGGSCGGASNCASGFCVDGVCCDSACGGQCQACDNGGSVGTCSPTSGAPHGNRAVCGSDGSSCAGTCDGQTVSQCTYSTAACRSPGCTNMTATLAAACDGQGDCPAIQTVACGAYACGASACLSSCADDGDCASGSYCSGGVCQTALPGASSCTGADQCGSGFCVDGVCCDSACIGQCQACAIPGSVGTCSPALGAPQGNRAACGSDGSSCGGSCNGQAVNQCTYSVASCRAATCSGETATLAATCNGQGACPAPQTLSCGSFACGASACLSSCASDGDCASGDYCNGGACQTKLPPASACSAANQCGSGFCVDGVCCNTACTGQCQACALAGSVGTCSPALGAPQGNRAACGSDGSSCGGSCNGQAVSQCTYSVASCRAATCTGETATLAATCNGQGACPAPQTISCGSFACGPSACLSSCASDGDCASGDYCNAGACQTKLSTASACTSADQCGSGFCVDGVCCNNACTDQCQACDVATSPGACTPVLGAPHGARAACASDGSLCGGSCDGVATRVCDYPLSACRSASCANAIATLPAFCDGSGNCPATQTQACSEYVCGPTACLGDCSSDGDCATGSFCAGGVCEPQGVNGATCGEDNQCTTGLCVDGVCCNAACQGQCEACDVAASLGTCSPTSGPPHGARATCASDLSACGGTCDGVNRASCDYPGSETSCRPGTCDGGVAVIGATCSGNGSCPALQQQSCGTFACGPSTCLGGCATDGDCSAGNDCFGGLCVPQLANGTACVGANQCTSGSCVDGVCCDVACSGQCQACDVSGQVGTCSAVTGTPHGERPDCLAEGTVCGGSCDGTDVAACQFPDGHTSCRSATCAVGTAILPADCDGVGNCPTQETQDCGQYVCGASGCLGTCAVDADCTTGDFCSGGICQPFLEPGARCSEASECGTGLCVDGVCCNSACLGQCEACDLPGQLGTCLPVAGAPVGSRTACASDGSSCGGQCNGTVRTACAYPPAGTSCRLASCSAGAATDAATCDGSGDCPASATTPCGDYVCAANACVTSCQNDGDCAPARSCVAGVCGSVPATGTTGTSESATSSSSAGDSTLGTSGSGVTGGTGSGHSPSTGGSSDVTSSNTSTTSAGSTSAGTSGGTSGAGSTSSVSTSVGTSVGSTSAVAGSGSISGSVGGAAAGGSLSGGGCSTGSGDAPLAPWLGLAMLLAWRRSRPREA